MTSMNRMVMAGETVDSTERREPGQCGLAPQTAAPVKEHPNELQRTLQENTPRDAQEGGEDEHPKWTDPSVMTEVNGISITSAVCMCSKVCKNLIGLKSGQ